MKSVWLLPLALLLAACQPPADSADTQAPETPPAVNAEPTASGQGSGGVQIHTGGAGGAAPVTGTESLGGGGSGVGAAAKGAAKRAAGTASQGSVGQNDMGGE